MAMPDDEVVRDYTVALTNIRDRLINARRKLSGGADLHTIESAALHIRVALKHLLLSALITHKADLGDVTKSLRKADASEARKRVEGGPGLVAQSTRSHSGWSVRCRSDVRGTP